jgi:peptide/nickel transport system permease protein
MGPGLRRDDEALMGRYVLRRILYAIPIAFGVSVVCFSLVYIAPGDPLQTVLPPDATAETIAIVKHAYGFDKPLPVQFLIWLGRVLSGNFGTSIATRRPVILEVSQALANTSLLALFAVPLAFIIGYAMGAVAGWFPGRWIDRVVTGSAVVGVSLPNYWLGIVLVIVFAVEYMVLPATGMGLNGSSGFDILSWNDAQYLVLPVVTLSMIPIGIIARTTRAAVAEVRNQDFVQTLRAKGLSEWAILRHVLKNALPPVMAVMGLQFGYLLGGSILVETVFTWPGSGFLLSKAIINRDVPVLQGTILTLAMVFVAVNLVVDLLQSLVDPRIRRG